MSQARPTDEEILQAFAQQTGPVNSTELAKSQGWKLQRITNQVGRLWRDGTLIRNAEGKFSLPPPTPTPGTNQKTSQETGTGKTPESITRDGSPTGEVPRVQQGIVTRLTQEEAGLTEYQIFCKRGLDIGIPTNVVSITADHIWNAGDYKDLKWVWQALGQMSIQPDLKARWWHSWRSYLHQGIPDTMLNEAEFVTSAGVGKKEAELPTPKEETRDYILTDDGPLRVGTNLGDFTLQDAKDIFAVRSIRNRPTTSTTGPTSGITPDFIMTLVEKLQSGRDGGQAQNQPKTVILQQTPQGIQMQELAPGQQPIVLNSPAPQSQQPQHFILDPETGQLRQWDPSQPFVLNRAQPAQPKTYLVTQDGQVKEKAPGEPIVIVQQQPAQASSLSTPIQLTDSQGNPIVMDLEKLISWKKFEGEEQRAAERHTGMMSLVKEIRENLPAGIEALKRAASGMQGGKKSQEAGKENQNITCQCGDCGTQFAIPPLDSIPEGMGVGCPNCGRVYTKEELQS